jgi:hypothetical protein
MTFPADLPDDIDALKAIILASQTKMADQDGIIERKEDRIIRLEKLLADFKRALYGAKSEKGHPDQYHFALEDIETAMAVVHAEDEAIDPSKKVASKSRVGRGVLRPTNSLAVAKVTRRSADCSAVYLVCMSMSGSFCPSAREGTGVSPHGEARA